MKLAGEQLGNLFPDIWIYQVHRTTSRRRRRSRRDSSGHSPQKVIAIWTNGSAPLHASTAVAWRHVAEAA